MAIDFFGGLAKNLAAFMPKDDPNTKIFQAQTNICNLETREQELYVQIGKTVYPSICNKPEFSEIVQELAAIQKKLENARLELQRVQDEKAEKDRQEEESLLNRTCSNCSTVNPDGVKFCQECGTKLGVLTKNKCTACGIEYPAEVRFCGECGSQL